MSSYITPEQYDALMHPKGIHPRRVSSRDGYSYVEAHDIKAAMIRIYGFGRFSWRIVEATLLFQRETKTNAGKDAWHVGYRVTGELTVCAPDGTVLAVYSGAHVGDSTHPQLGEAHGNALTNADSYAFKRAALYPLATQGGLGLYNKGSREEIVRWTLVKPEGHAILAADPDDVPQVHPEGEPAIDPRETTAASDPAPPDDVLVPNPDAMALRDALLAGPQDGGDATAFYMKLAARARREKLHVCQVPDADGVATTLGALADSLARPGARARAS